MLQTQTIRSNGIHSLNNLRSTNVVVYDIGLQRLRNQKNRVRGKNLIPILKFDAGESNPAPLCGLDWKTRYSGDTS